MNGDGYEDLVMGYDPETSSYSGQNLIFLNDGTGHFPVTVGFGTGGDRTQCVAVGDMDGDGDLDVAAVNGGFEGEREMNVVYLNNGTGPKVP